MFFSHLLKAAERGFGLGVAAAWAMGIFTSETGNRKVNVPIL